MNIKEIIRFELQYRSRRPATYLYFLILFILSALLSSLGTKAFGNVSIQVMANAPMIIDQQLGMLTMPMILLVSAIMGVAVIRDHEHRVDQLLFSSPLTKRDYLLGRFAGSFIIMLLVSLAIPLGAILGELFSSKTSHELLPFSLWNYIRGYLYIVIPNTFFLSALFFSSGVLTKKMAVIYTQGIVVLIIFAFLDEGAIETAQNLKFSTLFDLFMVQLIGLKAQFWSAAEINQQRIPFDGDILLNRSIYTSLGLIVLAYTYFRFSFSIKSSVKKAKSHD